MKFIDVVVEERKRLGLSVDVPACLIADAARSDSPGSRTREKAQNLSCPRPGQDDACLPTFGPVHYCTLSKEKNAASVLLVRESGDSSLWGESSGVGDLHNLLDSPAESEV